MVKGYDEKDLKRIEEALILLYDWYRNRGRKLPWRENPPVAYHVWLSEIMLQQTRIEAVKPHYSAFLEEFPTIEALAAAEKDRVLKVWEGLGYYSRAVNLKAAAEVIVEEHGCKFPQSFDEIRALPGIGEYTAGAVSSICFEAPEPAVDGNVLRVLMRYLGREDNIAEPKVRKSVTEALRDLYRNRMYDLFRKNLFSFGCSNQALMELGEVICIPNGTPLCAECPLRKAGCVAGENGTYTDIPVKAAKLKREIQNRNVYLIFDDEHVLIRKRPESGLLAGMYEFPNEMAADGSEVFRGLSGAGKKIRPEQVGEEKHIFSHIEWNLRVYAVDLRKNKHLSLSNVTTTIQQIQGFEQCLPASFDQLTGEYAMPKAFTKLYKYLNISGDDL